MDKSSLTVLICGILLLIFGIVIRYVIGRRRFKRRTIGGMQAFTGYNKSLLIPFIEGILMVLSFFMIIGGIIFIGLYSFFN